MSSTLSNGPADQAPDGAPVEGRTPASTQHPVQTQTPAPAQRPIPMLKVLVVLVGALAFLWYALSNGWTVSGGLIVGIVMLVVILLVGLSGKRL